MSVKITGWYKTRYDIWVAKVDFHGQYRNFSSRVRGSGCISWIDEHDDIKVKAEGAVNYRIQVKNEQHELYGSIDKKPIKECEHCGDDFRPVRKSQKYCCKNCKVYSHVLKKQSRVWGEASQKIVKGR